jgi:hypothetical protein
VPVVADGTTAPRSRQAPIRIGAVVALAVAIAFIVWLVVRGNDNSSTAKTTTVQSTTPTRTTPPPRETVKAASVASLRALAHASGHPIYWAGPQPDVKYELTQVTDGRIYIRYLPKSVPIRDKHLYPIVATYPVPNAYRAVRTAAKESGAVTFHTSRGGLAVYNQSAPRNVYLAYPGSKYQVEVFDPNPSRARRLVKTGAVRPIA